VILARLSTGVVSFEPDIADPHGQSRGRRIWAWIWRTHVGESLVDMAHTRPLLQVS